MYRSYQLNSYTWIDSSNPEPKRRYIQISSHARNEMDIYDIDPITLIDMLCDSFPCRPRGRCKKGEIELCSNRKRKIFRIKLSKDYCIDVREECWLLKHVKPQ